MTVIAGVEHAGGVTIGADSAGVGGLDLTVRADPKVFVNGPFLFGFTSSFRMGQILQYEWTPPARSEGIGDMAYLVCDVIGSIRTALKEGGQARNTSGEESGGTFLLGYKGKLYVVHDDFQVGVPAGDYAAVGCGDQVAHGVLFVTQDSEDLTPQQRVELALKAAERHSAGVRGPFVILSQDI